MHNRLIAFLLCLGLGSAAQPTVPIPFDDVYNFTFSPGQNARQVLSVLGNDYSPGGGTLEVTGITGITPPRAGTVIARATDVLYQVSSFDGSASTDYFQYTVRDSKGQTGVGTVAVNLASSGGSTSPSPSATAFSAVSDYYKYQFPSGQSVPRQTLNVLTNDTGTGLRILSVQTIGTFAGSIKISGNKKQVFYSIAQYSGATLQDVFAYTITDASNKGTRSALVTVDVSPSESAPLVANDNTYTLSASVGQTLSQQLKVLADDTGIGLKLVPFASEDAVLPLPQGSTLTGAVSITADSLALKYIVTFDGKAYTDNFRYRVQDANGQKTTALVTVNVVAKSPQTLQAFDDFYRYTPTVGATFTANLNVLSNDTGDIAYINRIQSTGPVRGQVKISADGQYMLYTLPSYDGSTFTDKFTYFIVGSNGATSSAAISVSVSSANPVALRAVPDSYSFQLDSNFNLARQTLRVMDNDTGIGISIASYKTGNFFGKLDLDKTNNLFYYEVSNYGGSAFTWYFNYTIRDVNFANSATTVTVNVAPPNLPFRAVDDAYSTTASANSLINKNIYVLDNDAGNGIALVGAVPLQSTTGSISISNDGQYLQYTAAVGSISGQTISDRFRYSIAEAADPSVNKSATLNITVLVN